MKMIIFCSLFKNFYLSILYNHITLTEIITIPQILVKVVHCTSIQILYNYTFVYLFIKWLSQKELKNKNIGNDSLSQSS